MLPISAEGISSPENPPFELSVLLCRATVLLSHDDRQHVLLRSGFCDLQFVLSGGNILQPARLSVDALWPNGLVKPRLWALECLNSLCVHGELSERLFPSEKHGQRLQFVLRALDGSLEQASHREIARVLIGEQRVDVDWRDPGNHLQDRIRRAIRRGHSLMNGGYRGFLN